MNTIADFYELHLQSSGEDVRTPCTRDVTPKTVYSPLLPPKNFASMQEESDEPSLTSSETSFSSLDDLWSSIRENEQMVEDFPLPPRRVSFHPHVEVREYSLTIGDHPYCDDAYPISLDWAFASPYIRPIETSKSRGSFYSPGSRLFVDEKRQRLAEVLGCSEEDIDAMAQSSMISLGRSILSLVAKLIPTVQQATSEGPTTNPFEEDDDEYRLMYAGTRESAVVRRRG